MKILFGTGYSAHAPNYFQFIQQLAHQLGASITVVHIYDEAMLLSEQNENYDDIPYTDQIRMKDESTYSQEVNKIDAFVEKNTNQQFKDLEINCIVQSGDIDKSLMGIIEKEDYPILVMGMRKHNFQERLFGNIVHRLMDNVSTPLLLIPPNIVIKPLQHIIYITAFEIGEESAVKFMLDWCKRLKVKMTLTHVVEDDRAIGVARQKLRSFRELFPKEVNIGTLSTRLLFGDIKPALKEFISRSSSDIVAMHRRKKGLWDALLSKSMTKDLAEDLAIPLLVLQDGNTE